MRKGLSEADIAKAHEMRCDCYGKNYRFGSIKGKRNVLETGLNWEFIRLCVFASGIGQNLMLQ
jgi:hypothetical protein